MIIFMMDESSEMSIVLSVVGSLVYCMHSTMKSLIEQYLLRLKVSFSSADGFAASVSQR